jgi:8-oxo-dGTP diphosphatase
VASAGIVQAAGALCWRRNDSGRLDVLLVHSARWGDWSWPKGKQDAGEKLPLTAVREVHEETGATIRLGLPLTQVEYVLPDGTPKRVRYWSGQVLSQDPATAGAEEIAESAWLTIDQAAERLTRPSDLPALQRLLELDHQGLLTTSQLIVIRHAKAISRAHWDGDEASRPLQHSGERQTRALTELLACWQPDRLISSSWTRCMQTITPYAQAHGLTVETDPALTEAAARTHPARTAERLATLLAMRGRIAACTHRPVLAAVMDTITAGASDLARTQLPGKDPWLRPGQLLIAHHRSGQVTWVEKH